MRMQASVAEHVKAKWSTFDTLSVSDVETRSTFILFLTLFGLISFLTSLHVWYWQKVDAANQGDQFHPLQFWAVNVVAFVIWLKDCYNVDQFPDAVGRKHDLQDTHCMEFSMRVMVRKAARLAVYEEMTMRANIHQTPIIIRVASVVYGTSPPAKKRQAEKGVKAERQEDRLFVPTRGKSVEPTKIISGFTNLISTTHRNRGGTTEKAILRQPL